MYFALSTPLPAFLPLPRFLLPLPLSLNAKLVYALLLERTTLSQQNGWVDDDGRVFIIYPIQRIAQDLGRSERTICTALRELDRAGLLRRVRKANNQPNRIYLLMPEEPQLSSGVTGNSCVSQAQKASTSDGQNLPANLIEREETKRNQTEGEGALVLGAYQNVSLSPSQLSSLKQRHGASWAGAVERLSTYMAETGRRYASHYAVLRRWIAEDARRGKKTAAAIHDGYEGGESL